MKKGRDPFVNYAVVRASYLSFFGYVKGRQHVGDRTSVRKMAIEFMETWALMGEIEDYVMSYKRMCRIIREAKSNLK